MLISNFSKLRLAFSYYTGLLHEATPTNHALMHEAYTVQMHIPSYCNNLRSQGGSLLNMKVGSEVNNIQVESTMCICAYTFPITVYLP